MFALYNLTKSAQVNVGRKIKMSLTKNNGCGKTAKCNKKCNCGCKKRNSDSLKDE